MSSTTIQDKRAGWDWNIWIQWILANAVGETVGLGGTLVIGGLLLPNAQKTMGVVPAAALAVLAGILIEGITVGTAQWLVLRRPIKSIRWRVWALATAIGAFVAWTLGMIPSTLMFSDADSGGAAPAQISDLCTCCSDGICSGADIGCTTMACITPPSTKSWLVGVSQCSGLDGRYGDCIYRYKFHPT